MGADHSDSTDTAAQAPMAGTRCQRKPALRILLFDDQYTCPAVIRELAGVVGSKPDNQDLWIPNGNYMSRYDRFVWQGIGLELILCTSFKHSLRLISEHFDILLLDVDFAKDPDPVEGFTEPSHLGGILLGLCFLTRRCTISQVYTAQDSRLRRDNIDYWYLDQARKLSPKSLASIAIEVLDRKNLRTVLEKTFARWCIEVAPNLRPDARSLVQLIDCLNSGDVDGVAVRLLAPRERSDVCAELIPAAMFKRLLSPEYRGIVLTALNKAVCGHQLVRRAFCKDIHIGNCSAACIRSCLSNEHCCDQHTASSRHDFHSSLEEASRLFGLDHSGVLSLLKGDADQKCKTHTRIDLSEALELASNSGAIIFGLFANPKVWKQRFRTELVSHLLDRSKGGAVTVVCQDLAQDGQVIAQGTKATSWGRKIAVIGNRNDPNYLTTNGGNWDSLLKNCQLDKIASDLRLVGPNGSVNLKTWIVTQAPTSATVQLEISVHHTPATEPM